MCCSCSMPWSCWSTKHPHCKANRHVWLTALGHALAAIVLLLLIIGAVLLCTICHCMATRQLQTPAVKPSGHRRYKGMKEFEMPELKNPTWGMP